MPGIQCSSPISGDFPRYSLRRLLIAVLVIAVLAAVCGAIGRSVARHAAENARIQKMNRQTEKDIAKEVEDICRQLGRSPQDEEALERIRGKPLPSVYYSEVAIPIFYSPRGTNSFVLVHLSFEGGDYLVYDSTAPAAGWKEVYD